MLIYCVGTPMPFAIGDMLMSKKVMTLTDTKLHANAETGRNLIRHEGEMHAGTSYLQVCPSGEGDRTGTEREDLP